MGAESSLRSRHTRPSLRVPFQEAEQPIAQFPVGTRSAVAALAAQAPALADLVTSFPGLLVALATGYGSPIQREVSIGLVLDGAPLRVVAAKLGLPSWIRHLPPAAFSRPLVRVPSGDQFSARIVDALPVSPALSSLWLRRVLYAAEACHEDYALWLARHYRRSAPPLTELTLCHLAAWAWHSSRADLPAGRLVRRPWHPDIGIKRAIEEAIVWRRRIALAAAIAARRPSPWISGGSTGTVEVVPLVTVEDFLAEAAAMDNCLDQFAERIETGLSWVYSIRRDGKPLADVEIGLTDHAVGVPTVLQLRGPRNRQLPPEMWRIVYAWLAASALPVVLPERVRASVLKRQRSRLWAPYIAQLPRLVIASAVQDFADVGPPPRRRSQLS
jgi:hypothetical protein